MSTGYKIREEEAAYYLTFQIVGWVDIFTRKRYRDVVIESFKYCQQNNNPVRAGIVQRPEDYVYSSARNYAELEYVVDVIKIDFLWKAV